MNCSPTLIPVTLRCRLDAVFRGPGGTWLIVDWKTGSRRVPVERQVTIAGRIMSRRIMGKASFMELQDSTGRIQVYITREDLCPDENNTEQYNTVFKKLLDIGDFVGIKGFVFRT